jgi:transposase-like protein
VLKIRANQRVINKSLYLALGINGGSQGLLGLWLAETEEAKFWLSVLTEESRLGRHPDCVCGRSQGLP